jgi:hypothetical protein
MEAAGFEGIDTLLSFTMNIRRGMTSGRSDQFRDEYVGYRDGKQFEKSAPSLTASTHQTMERRKMTT